MIKGAFISDDNRYRYSLSRVWDDDLPLCTFGMVNPSTADHKSDDPTVRKCIGFAKRLGFGGLIVWNLFAFRSPNVKDLSTVDCPEGPINDVVILRALRRGQKHFVAWGAKNKLPKPLRGRIDSTMFVLSDLHGYEFHCIGTTKDGDPRHPLMTPYSQRASPWPVPKYVLQK